MPSAPVSTGSTPRAGRAIFASIMRSDSLRLPRPPRGRILSQASRDKDEVVTAECDLRMIAEVRAQWQFYRDRRPDLYGPLTND